MFFYLSKKLVFLFNPFTYIVILLIWAWITKIPARRKKLLISSVIAIFFFGNFFILDEVIRPWELDSQYDSSKKYDITIVLGGMIIYDAENDVMKFNSNADRLLRTLPLLQNGKTNTIFFSGGSGDIYHPENLEADMVLNYLKSIHFPTDSFYYENKSRNTYENALHTVEELKKKYANLSSKSILLVTSGLHMRRSLACFKKQGIACDYISTNQSAGPRKFQFNHCFVPQIAAISGWDHLSHELIGYFSYYLTDKI